MNEKPVYIYDSLHGQTLRVVQKTSPSQIDFFISDAMTAGSIHDHSGVDLHRGHAFNVYRGQQKT